MTYENTSTLMHNGHKESSMSDEWLSPIYAIREEIIKAICEFEREQLSTLKCGLIERKELGTSGRSKEHPC